jgi:hypothetical protein
MAVINLESKCFFSNIDKSHIKLRYSTDNGIGWWVIDIPEGSYEVKDINEYIQRIMEENRHYNAANEKFSILIERYINTLKCVHN